MKYSLCVLYVDRDPRDDVLRALDGIDADVECVDSLADCLTALEREREGEITCIVTESDLPDGDGVEICEGVRDRRPDVPIVVYTDTGTETLAGDVVAAGADGYVPKSQGIETLVTRVIELSVDHKRARDGREDGRDENEVAGDARGDREGNRTRDHTPWLHTSADDTADRFEYLVGQSPYAIVEWNRSFEVVSWNRAATGLFGYEPAETIGRHATELVVPDDAYTTRAHWEGSLSDRTTGRRITRNVRKDGETITCEWFTTPLVDETGQIVSVLSFVQEVTDEIERTDALESLQETTHNLIRANSSDEIAATVVETIETVIERSRAFVALYDDEDGHLGVTAIGCGDGEEFGPITPGDGVFWESYDRQEAVVVSDDSSDAVPAAFDHPSGTVIVHPLGEHGILAVTSPEECELRETDSDFHLVSVLAATAETALDRAYRQRELERVKTVVETVGDSVYALDRDGNFVTINDTLASVTGYPRDELVGEHISKILSAESAERRRREIDAVLEADDDSVVTCELTVETRHGEHIPCEVNTTALRSNGSFDGTVGIVRDTSDRKAIEHELRERKQKMTSLHGVVSSLEGCETDHEIYEETVESAMDVLNFDVCLIGSVQGERFVTEAVLPEECARTTPERVPRAGIAEHVYRTQQTYRTDDIEADENVQTGEGDPDAGLKAKGFRSLLSVPIGEFAVFQAVSNETNAFDQHDQELAELLISHALDALDRGSFEAKLREERDRFAALFENVPDAVVSVHHGDEDGSPIVERVNPAFERVFGYDESELQGESLDRFIVPTDRTADAETFNRRGSSGEIVEAEVKRRTADGLRDFMMRVVPMDVETDQHYSFGVYTDITEQKQRQKRVEILNRVLRHDLRNGMNIIDGCAEMLAEVVDDANRRYAETIQERASELIALAEKTRAVERTLDRENAATGPVNVVDSIEETIERIDDDYPEAEITCSLPDVAHARADEMLETAITHVVENAVEHNDMPVTEIDITIEETDDTLALSIADNGPGIPTEEKELLQEEKEITQLRHASGLGLWLVNWTVTHSGGTLSFETNEPRGTIVTLEVPKAESPSSLQLGDSAVTGD